ncbi:MAG: LemA family protein [Clostridiales bacterium]|nr:LemA family protein [Clostridiales bacterium]
MLTTFISIAVSVTVIAFWIISIRRRLEVMDENISHAMRQIGVQVSARFDALTALLNLTKNYEKQESEILIEIIKSRRSVITARSTPDDVAHQERVFFEVLDRISMVTEQYPELKTNQTYIKTMSAIQTFEIMVCTSRLIYNDSVNKLNREIRMLPISTIAGMLGFQRRTYLVDQADEEYIPSIK